MILEILNEARLDEQGIRLLLVGEGPAYSDLLRYARDHGLERAVVFTGPVGLQDIPTYIAAMDVAVQPSCTEYASPMKIFEYMAMGKCIVAPDQANVREILDDGVTGFLFKPGDKEALKAALQALAKDSVARGRAGRRAYERIFERRSLWSANAQRALGLIASTRSAREIDDVVAQRAVN
jgi:glycosyltransferase involved in cell wall biosynthesis